MTIDIGAHDEAGQLLLAMQNMVNKLTALINDIETLVTAAVEQETSVTRSNWMDARATSSGCPNCSTAYPTSPTPASTM